MISKLSKDMPGLLKRPVSWEDLPLPKPGLMCDGRVPTETECVELWNYYKVPAHIRRHSELVAAYAMHVGRQLVNRGVKLDLDGLYASALLHDIAKMYCIERGGSHAQVGAAWVVQKTRQHLLAQGVMFHVYWPWKVCFKSWPLPLILEYADKRVKHDQLVGLDERFKDLMERYGHDQRARANMHKIGRQAEELERQLAELYKVDVNADFTYSWRLV